MWLTFRDALKDVASHWHESESDFCWISDTTKIGGRYRGDPAPFVGGVHDLTHPEKLIDCRPTVLAIEACFGLTCRSAIDVAAMSNGDRDHQILAEVVAFLAEQFKGVVAFNGLIPVGDILPLGLHVIEWVDEPNFIGKTNYSEHCATADAVRWWLSQPNFRMCK